MDVIKEKLLLIGYDTYRIEGVQHIPIQPKEEIQFDPNLNKKVVHTTNAFCVTIQTKKYDWKKRRQDEIIDSLNDDAGSNSNFCIFDGHIWNVVKVVPLANDHYDVLLKRELYHTKTVDLPTDDFIREYRSSLGDK